MLEKIKSFFKKVNDTVNGWIVKVGTSKETGENNLLGLGLKLGWGLLKLPFAGIWWLGTTGYLAVTKPSEAWFEIRFLGWKVMEAAKAFIGIEKTKYGVRLTDRSQILLWVWLFGSMFAPFFIEAGFVKIGLTLFLGPLAALTLTGIRPVMVRLQSLRREDFELEVAHQEADEALHVHTERAARAAKVNEAAENLHYMEHHAATQAANLLAAKAAAEANHWKSVHAATEKALAEAQAEVAKLKAVEDKKKRAAQFDANRILEGEFSDGEFEL